MIHHLRFRGEEGLYSVIMLLLMAVMSIMSASTLVLIRAEASSISFQGIAFQGDYAANGAAYFGIQCIQEGSLNENQPINIGNASISLDSSRQDYEIFLDIDANVGGLDRGIHITLRADVDYEKAICSTGDVDNISAKDPYGNWDPGLIEENMPELPYVDIALLIAMSSNQGHDQADATFTPADGYPNDDFYTIDGITPNVTHVLNNLKVSGGISIYGIFIVDGTITIDGGARIDGVILSQNGFLTIIKGGGDPSESSVTGGILSYGDIKATGNHVNVQLWPEYLNCLAGCHIDSDSVPLCVVAWEYQ
ncbi:hypothetical protein BVY01_04895 [bacterium I07]|nr:hypothetical protein BVY01_04895 [bacterium I07]